MWLFCDYRHKYSDLNLTKYRKCRFSFKCRLVPTHPARARLHSAVAIARPPAARHLYNIKECFRHFRDFLSLPLVLSLYLLIYGISDRFLDRLVNGHGLGLIWMQKEIVADWSTLGTLWGVARPGSITVLDFWPSPLFQDCTPPPLLVL